MEEEIRNNKIIINSLAITNFLLLTLSYLGIYILLLTSDNSKLNNIIVVAIGVLFGTAYKELWKTAIGSRIKKLKELDRVNKKKEELISFASSIKSAFNAYANFFQIILLTIYISKILRELSDKINSGIFWFIVIILFFLNIVSLIHALFSYYDEE
ncbi:hypothetical protein [Staphylococcus hominis]|uniref:hypothetical protein n=2 Tax=Staphylococcus hominis TaxID=1290 RepID=UPI0011A994CC|nr:hypothetical protein [Staphylococcus hominis]